MGFFRQEYWSGLLFPSPSMIGGNAKQKLLLLKYWTSGFVKGNTDWNYPPPPQPGKIVATCMYHLRTGGHGKEHRTKKLPPIGKMCERSKGERRRSYICFINLLESSLESILAEWHMPPEFTRKGPESKWLARDHLETNPIPIKPETVSHVAKQSSWVLLRSCSPPRCPCPQNLLLCQCVSP